MLETAPRDLLAPLFGIRSLVRHPWQALMVVVVATLLGQAAVAARIWLHLDGSLQTQVLLQAATMLPVELFLTPRFLLMADAMDLDTPANPAATWTKTFEARWGAMALAKLAFTAAFITGSMLFLLPGLLVLFFFGWTPLHILLRGGSLPEAAAASREIMARAWPRVVGCVLILTGLFLMGALATALPIGLLFKDPDLWTQFRHPLFWATQAIAGLLGLWYSASLMAIYQGVRPVEVDQSSK